MISFISTVFLSVLCEFQKFFVTFGVDKNDFSWEDIYNSHPEVFNILVQLNSV